MDKQTGERILEIIDADFINIERVIKHRELVRAYLYDNAIIQAQYHIDDNDWVDVRVPVWDVSMRYRIKAELPATELTVAEIEAKLGYKIKIIKGCG